MSDNLDRWARCKGGNLGVGFEFDQVEFWVDPRMGARTTVLAWEGRNLLVGPDVHAENFGSTFWTSPQSDWDWPPPPEIDSLPYAPEIENDSFTLVSRRSERFGVEVKKRYRADRERACIHIDYVLVNGGDQVVHYAPWEVTRVRGELSFYPAGGRSFKLPHLPAVTVTEAERTVWFPFEPHLIESDQKIFAHAPQPWLAHVAGRTLFVKTFPQIDEAEQAPGEAMVEIYARGDHSYIELEQQGPYRTLAPGDELTWPVRWYLRKLDRAIEPRAGDRALLAAVEKIVADERLE